MIVIFMEEIDEINQIIDITKVKPKVLPFKCPNCSGYGTVQYGKKVCHSCNGKGYILVNQEEDIHE